MFKLFRAFHAISLTALLLSGCAEMSGLSGSQADAPLLNQAEAALTQAQLSDSPEKEYHQIQAADMLREAGQPERAARILGQVNTDVLPMAEFVDYTLLYAEVSMQMDDYLEVLDLTQSPRIDQLWEQIPARQQRQLLTYRAEIQALLGDEFSAFNSYLALSALQTGASEITETHSRLWSILLRLPYQQLHTEITTDDNMTGWLALARQFRDNQGNIRQQLKTYSQWKFANPSHPATLYPPEGITALQALSANLPEQIALMLPLSGRLADAGQVIQSGFLAAWFDNQANYADAPRVRIYDTAGKEAISDIYQRAVTEGAQLIIGPLDKDKVEELNQGANMTVPTIALNYLEQKPTTQQPVQTSTDAGLPPLETTDAQPLLFQMGLLVEDEARQVAERAWQEGKRQALLVSSQMQWAERASKAFLDAWESRGGFVETLPAYRLDQRDFAPLLKPALHIDNSLSRNQRLEKLLGKDLAFTPRRRQDLDMVFLVAYPDQARQIKPTLNFLFAHDLDVYATSQIYNGNAEPARNRDLNRIRFSTMPWTLEGYLSDTLMPDDSIPPAYRQLYALGMDAYLIHQWIQQLQNNPQTTLSGATGTLHLEANNQIHRQLPWAIFRNGRVKPIYTTSNE